MKGKGFYIVIIIILIILNLGTLSYIWLRHPGNDIHGQRRNAAEFLISELNLTSQQKGQFLRLREMHSLRMRVYQQKDRELHNRFFDQLRLLPENSLLIGQLADSMAMIRKNMEVLTFDHFRKIRQILSNEQKEKFDDIFHETLKLVLPPPPPPPPPPPVPGRE